MTNNYEKVLDAFELKLRKLISDYKLLQTQYGDLLEEYNRTSDLLKKSYSENITLTQENKSLRMANVLKGNSEDVLETKRQIAKIVREIDKCISLIDD